MFEYQICKYMVQFLAILSTRTLFKFQVIKAILKKTNTIGHKCLKKHRMGMRMRMRMRIIIMNLRMWFSLLHINSVLSLELSDSFEWSGDHIKCCRSPYSTWMRSSFICKRFTTGHTIDSHMIGFIEMWMDFVRSVSWFRCHFWILHDKELCVLLLIVMIIMTAYAFIRLMLISMRSMLHLCIKYILRCLVLRLTPIQMRIKAMAIKYNEKRELIDCVGCKRRNTNFLSDCYYNRSSHFYFVWFNQSEKQYILLWNVYLCNGCTQTGLTWTLFMISPKHWKEKIKEK